jgi:hypothetical protein
MHGLLSQWALNLTADITTAILWRYCNIALVAVAFGKGDVASDSLYSLFRFYFRTLLP